MVLVGPESKQQAQEFIHALKVFTVGDALGFDDQEGLEGMDDFLDDFPVFGVLLYAFDIAFEDFVNFFILFDEYQQEVMGSFSDFGLF